MSGTQISESESTEALIEWIVTQTLNNEESAKTLNRRLYAVLKRIFSPRIEGADNIPKQPVLLVGNHAVFALDVPLIQSAFVHTADRLPLAMSDKILFANKVTRNLLVKQGGILGHPDVCSTLMQRGKDLLVFPGGSHEVNKPVDQRYELKWKERYGFVRLAAEHGYTILPVATVGPDEFYGRYMEGSEWFESRLGKLLVKQGLLDPNTRQDLLPPIPRGVFGTLLPKPQKVYISFGKPIDLSQYKTRELTRKKLHQIRSQVADSINAQISQLLLLRARNSESEGWLRKMMTR